MDDIQEETFPIRIQFGTNQDDGSVVCNVEYGDEFKTWFMEREGLKRWSEKRFQKVIGPLIEQYYEQAQEESDEAPLEPTPERVL